MSGREYEGEGGQKYTKKGGGGKGGREEEVDERKRMNDRKRMDGG
jgi:hypothetical protein